MSRIGLAAGGMVLIGAAILGWGWFADGTSSTGLNGVSQIQIGGAGDGDVEIRRGSTAQVEQKVDRWFGGLGDNSPLHRVQGETLVLDTDCGFGCAVDYVVTLPEEVPVNGEVGDGALRVTGMESVRAHVSSGDIVLREISGGVRADTDSGEVKVSDVGGEVNVETASGNIIGERLDGAQVRGHTDSGDIRVDMGAPRNVDLRTGSGDLNVTVPQGRYRVDSHPGDGEDQIDVTQDPNASQALKLHTDSGDIRLRAG